METDIDDIYTYHYLIIYIHLHTVKTDKDDIYTYHYIGLTRLDLLLLLLLVSSWRDDRDSKEGLGLGLTPG